MSLDVPVFSIHAASWNFSYFVICSCIYLVLVSVMRAHFQRQKMPPGPRGLPLLGNIFQMPTDLPWIRFAEFSKKYGPVVSFMAAGRPVIVLNDHKSSFELLERRSLFYSHRPRFIMAGELLCEGIMLSFISYGDLFRRMRRTSHATFGPSAAEQFRPLQEAEAVCLVYEIFQRPESWEEFLKRSTSSNILTATYGWPRLTDAHIPLLKRIHEHTARLANACIPGKSMVDIFPILNYLPSWMAGWKRDALAWHTRESEMFEKFYKDVGKQMEDETAKKSFVSSMTENDGKNGLSLKEASWLAGIMFSAGAETITVSISTFFIAMIHYPEVMRKAQAQIDQVVGHGRPPSFSDRPNLPYIRAIVKELLRWRPAGPMGIPRRAARDDWYDGYFIPKGATVISNVWAINRDPLIYTDPEDFVPERHLDSTETIDISPPDMHSLGHTSFGFGRRTCVGVTFANQSLFINFATLLWAFNIEKANDHDGNELLPSLTDVVDGGVVVGPVPFRCRFVPRFPDVGEVLERSVANA